MFHATEINYIIEGRIKNVPFKATGHKIREGLYQVRVEERSMETLIVGNKEACDPFAALWSVVEEWWQAFHEGYSANA